MLKIKNQAEDAAELYINGFIIDDEDGGRISEWYENTDGYQWPQDLKRQLDELKNKNLTIYINSQGGSIPAGVAMAHFIERHKGRTTAIVDGYCCSVATQIFFAADVCKMPKNSWLMIHKPYSMEVGNADEMRKAAEALDALQEGLEVTYRKKALESVTPEEIHNMVNAETWFTGDKAAEKFRIEVLDSQKALNCIGSLDALKAMGVKKIPPSLNFIKEEKNTPPKECDWTGVNIALARAKGAVVHC